MGARAGMGCNQAPATAVNRAGRKKVGAVYRNSESGKEWRRGTTRCQRRRLGMEADFHDGAAELKIKARFDRDTRLRDDFQP